MFDNEYIDGLEADSQYDDQTENIFAQFDGGFDDDDDDDLDDEFDEEDSSFDDDVFDIDFSEIQGKNFKQTFSRVNRKIAARKTVAPKSTARQSASNGRRAVNRVGIKTKNRSNFRPSEQGQRRPAPKKPLNNRIPVKEGKYNLKSQRRKKIAKVIVPDDQKVIIQGASKFILSQSAKDNAIKNIQWYKGEKLQPLVLIINNDTPVDFDFELFNPSMPLDYLYSTSQNLNDRITVAGGIVSYTDVLFNILANPTLIINVQTTTAGPQVANQNNQSLFIKNKTIEGVQTIYPVNLDLKIDNLQVLNDIIYFNVHDTINRAYVPDGMDVIQYKVLAGMTVTMCFWYKQTMLKKLVYKEARDSKQML